MNEWREVRLGDIASIVGGGTPSTKNPENYNGHIPWITPKDLSSFKQRYISAGERFITQEGLDSSSARLLPQKTVLFTSRAPIGYIAIAKNELSTNQGFKSLVFKDGNDPEFFYYLLKHITPKIKSLASGSTFLEINSQAIKSIKVKVPVFELQKTIAHILGTLDNKIELNQQMNETLETMAMAIFKDWFVDFGPTRRKMEGVTDPIAILGYLLDDPLKAVVITDLFPCLLSNNGLPKQWKKTQISELCETVGGATPSTKNNNFWSDGIHAWATPKDLSKLSGMFVRNTNRTITDLGLTKISSGLSPKGSILLSSRAPIGYIAIASVPIAVNQGFIVLRPSKLFPTAYGYFWCRYNMNKMKANANGSTFQEINKKNFRSIPAISPPIKLLDQYVKVVSPILSLIESYEAEMDILAEIRKFLLPKLITGQVRLHGVG